MSFNKKYENFKLTLLRIFVGIRIRDPDPGVQTGSGSQPFKLPGSGSETLLTEHLALEGVKKHCQVSWCRSIFAQKVKVYKNEVREIKQSKRL